MYYVTANHVGVRYFKTTHLYEIDVKGFKMTDL